MIAFSELMIIDRIEWNGATTIMRQLIYVVTFSSSSAAHFRLFSFAYKQNRRSNDRECALDGLMKVDHMQHVDRTISSLLFVP